jgi:tRNA-guanine family transglycosylase
MSVTCDILGMYASDTRPIEPGCDCSTCLSMSRAYLHSVAAKETVGARLITVR